MRRTTLAKLSAMLMPVSACIGASGVAPSSISVETTLSATALRANDTLKVMLVGTNTSGHTIEVLTRGCIANLDVVNQRDEQVALGDPRVCAAIAYRPTAMAPGSTWRDSITIVVRAAPGQYRVRAGLPDTDGVRYGAAASLTVTR